MEDLIKAIDTTLEALRNLDGYNTSGLRIPDEKLEPLQLKLSKQYIKLVKLLPQYL